jgi:hypothetical protein
MFGCYERQSDRLLPFGASVLTFVVSSYTISDTIMNMCYVVPSLSDFWLFWCQLQTELSHHFLTLHQQALAKGSQR